ncbi:hypothetical protein KAR48_13900 [bacterium]|nr:hypothetical protein [bacterium]
MLIKMIFSGLIGLIFGTVGMAILASGGRAGEIEKESIMRDALKRVWRWHQDQKINSFPKNAVKDALDLD